MAKEIKFNIEAREMLKKGVETRPGFYPFSVMPLYKTNENGTIKRKSAGR